VKNATKIPVISYEEMLEMASSGSKVMQSRSVEFAKKFGVRFEVRNSMNQNPGTLVTEEDMSMESVVIRGVSLERDQAKITIEGVPDSPGKASQIFTKLGTAHFNIDMIVQNVGVDGQAAISFTLPKNDLARARECITPAIEAMGAKLRATEGIAKVSAVGIGMRSHSGVAAQMFEALGQAGINIQMISTSEIKISVVIDGDKVDEAARVVHDAFKLGKGFIIE
jgi:aspartate kinase